MHTKNGVKDAYQKAKVNRFEVKSIKFKKGQTLWHTKSEAKVNRLEVKSINV